jgi:asparagine synthase (glutamine-hydrolysing)
MAADLPAPMKPVARVLDLVDPTSQELYGTSIEDARAILRRGDLAALRSLRGSFALTAREGEKVLLARSLERPLRYFLAKEKDGPMLIVAERIDQIRDQLAELGYLSQFHPSYTRMVPAHHLTELRLIGCPDPNPRQRRFFAPPRAVAKADLDAIGEAYVGALLDEVGLWLDNQDENEPIGVLFSGGVDSGAVFLALYHQLLASSRSPARLKAFTLAAEGGGGDPEQAAEFLRRLDLGLFLETIEVGAAAIDTAEAIAVIEDYKPLDVECAAAQVALLRALRERYPEWKLLADGDGGDENLKDYPIEENPELTIRSVVNNSMLYQEGWGVEAVKHSQTFSGGLSRGAVRGWAPCRRFGFRPFSPFMRPALVEVAESIPFAELTGGSHEKLYALKGEVVARGFRRLLGLDFPVFPKRRFQHGALAEELRADRFAASAQAYRRQFLELFAT